MNASILNRTIWMIAALFVLAAAAGIPARDAAAQSPLAFGIQPTQEPRNGAETRPYFIFALDAGAQANDWVSVTNNGADPVTLNLYPADGITSINGSTAFAAAGEIRHNTGSWLHADIASLLVPPGEAVVVPFHVQVPADAQPGDHVAGWVVEAPPRPGDAGGVGASVTERAGVAVVVTVPGVTESALLLGQICLNQETGSNYFETPIRNDGNVLTKAEGILVLDTEDGEEVFDRPAELGSVVPGDATFLRLDAPQDPGPGNYVATIRLTTSDGTEIETSNAIKIGDKKINGCTAVEAQDDGPGGLPILRDLPGGSTPWAILLALGAMLAILLGLRTFLFRRRKAVAAAPAGRESTPVEIEDDEVT